MASRVTRPSVLLQHIHGTIPALTRLYEEAATTTASASPGRSAKASVSVFPPDPQTNAEGERVLDFFCSELGMGRKPLTLWRERAAATAHRYWHPTPPSSLPAPVLVPHSTSPSSSSSSETPPTPLYLQPRHQDVVFMQSAMAQLRLLPSPLITLSPPPSSLQDSTPSADNAQKCTVEASTTRPTSEASTSRFYATRRIPAGMFVLSLPTEAVLMAQPPPAADPVLSFFLHLDDLIGQLAAAEAEGPSHPYFHYVRYLKDSVVPGRNLPFLSRKALQKLVGPSNSPPTESIPTPFTSEAPDPAVSADPTTDKAHLDQVLPLSSPISATAQSPAWALWEFFHESMESQPLSPYLRERLSSAEYTWWASVVLARRTGVSMLLPVADKLNHHPLPNCYYTMSNEASLCGLDVLDNLIAGVPLDLLYQPYVHVFTIRTVEPGEELTLCYTSPEQGHYRPASRQMPPAPSAALDSRRQTAPEDLAEVFASLFPSSSSTTTTTAAPRTPPLREADEVAQALQRVAHPASRQEVQTPEGRARWQLQWGFVPTCDAVFSAKDLEEVAGIVAERRVDTRADLFPPTPPQAH